MTTSARRTSVTWGFPQSALIEYAGAARDFNAIHYDAAAARAAGFERPIVHGMLTLGRALVLLEEQYGVDSVAEVSVRFGAPLLVDSDAEAVVEDSGGGSVGITVAVPGGADVLTGTARLRGGAPGDPAPLPEGAELVASRILVVERGPATRFALALGASSAAYLEEAAGRRTGLPGSPTVPSFTFALPGWGFFPDREGNEGQGFPDAVRECQQWCGTADFPIHATQGFVFSRPLCVGDVVLARTHVVGRRRKESSSRVLHFTDVRTDFTEPGGAHVVTSLMGLVVIEPLPAATPSTKEPS